MDDSASWTPKTDPVFGRDGAQKVVHLFVCVNGNAKVDLGANFCRDEMVAVNS